MKNYNLSRNQTTNRILPVASATALAAAFAVSLSQPAHADRVTPPPVPENIQAPEGSKAFLKGHGVGTQNYICLPSGAGLAWTLFTPQATLFSDNDKQITTHYFSPNPNPNPAENGVIRATWQHSRDTSTVWAKVTQPSSDPEFVAPDAIPWLLLEVVGQQKQPTGGDTLTKTIAIQRLNTSGGVAPSTGCANPTDVGKKEFVPYEADYFFYKKAETDSDEDN